jgi:hypothetical protein
MPADAPARRSSEDAAAVFGASLRAVRGPGIHLPVTAALVLVVSTVTVTGSYGLHVLAAVAVVLGLALQSAVDDPERSILAAAPYPLATRVLNRVAAVVSFAAPVWLVAAAVIRWQLPAAPLRALTLQTLALWAVAVMVALCVWRASASTTPSYIASPLFLGVVLAGNVLPPRWQMFDAQQWGPPWVAAQLRWCALLLFAAGVIALLLDDPNRPRRARVGERARLIEAMRGRCLARRQPAL